MDDSVATVSHDRLLKLRNTETGEERYSVVAHKTEVYSVAFSPNGRTIATAGNDQVINFWHPETGQPLGAIRYEGPILAKIRFCPDHFSLAAKFQDGGDVVIYDATLPRSPSPPRKRASARKAKDPNKRANQQQQN